METLKKADLSRWKVVKLALFFEGAIALIALFWIRWGNLEVPFGFVSNYLLYSLLGTFPILTLNGLLFFLLGLTEKRSPYARFMREYIFPLCASQSMLSAFFIGLASGIGEEFFFRGALFYFLTGKFGQPISILVINLLFAYVHFIGNFLEYWRVFIFYFLFGVYFTFLVMFLNSIWIPVLTHALYNWIVIVAMRYYLITKNPKI